MNSLNCIAKFNKSLLELLATGGTSLTDSATCAGWLHSGAYGVGDSLSRCLLLWRRRDALADRCRRLDRCLRLGSRLRVLRGLDRLLRWLTDEPDSSEEEFSLLRLRECLPFPIMITEKKSTKSKCSNARRKLN